MTNAPVRRHGRRVGCLVGAVTIACGGEPPAGPVPPIGNPGLAVEVVASGLAAPIDLASPAGDGRVFVANQDGVVQIVVNGEIGSTPYLDISSDVRFSGEQGLLGIAFHPEYRTNGLVFVSYTDRGGASRVDRFRVSDDPDVIDVSSRVNIITVDQHASNHNGGQIAFGPDGMLFFALGDGGGANDPANGGQDRGTLWGSLLRLDVDAALPYGIPPDNPFVGSTTARPEIWAYGLRNPWRFSFDPAGTAVYIADVGQDSYEEVNVQPAGAPALNYGWNIMEGTHCRPGGNPDCDQTGLTLPAVEYSDGCAVIGGYVYRGSAIPAIVGHYFYSDLCGRWLRSFRWVDGEIADHRQWPNFDLTGAPTSFGLDGDGEMYVLAGDAVHRIVARP